MIQRICVCGAGTMGSGIAQAAATAGFHTILYDINKLVLAAARSTMNVHLRKLEAKRKIPDGAADQIHARIRYTDDLHECLADIIIEAVVEKSATKIALFNQLAEINHGETIFASNTSSLSLTDIAAQVLHPHRVVGMHFFNPAPLMKLVEVVTTRYTTETITQTVVRLAQEMGKTPVVCTDSPGFIVNRVARPFYIEAFRIAEEGVVSFADIDVLMEATGFRMGPFRLMDLIGNDVNYAVSVSVYEQLGRPDRLQPSDIQFQMVEQGALGRKTGNGYYPYADAAGS